MEEPPLMDWSQLGALFTYFLVVAFLAIGGAPSLIPELHRYLVDVHGYMTSAQFAEMYALAQVAPGPNIMYVPLLGWHIAGWAGAIATLVPMLIPSASLTVAVAYLYARHPAAAFGIAFRRGLTPITIGLICASGWILLPAVNRDWRGYVLTVVTVAVVMRTPLNPLWLLLAGAVAGVTGLV
jgi:chromate transporter